MIIQIADQDLVRQIERLAVEEDRPAEQIVADALRLYTGQTQKISGAEFLLLIAGQGHSGQTDVSEQDEAILTTEIDPVRGWHAEPLDENSA